MEGKYCKESRVIRTSRVFPNDVNNNHNTLFGGKLMSDLDPNRLLFPQRDIVEVNVYRHQRIQLTF